MVEVKDSKNPNKLFWHYRVGIVVSEIYVTLVIEEIAIGEESFRTLISSRGVDLGTKMAEKIEWVSPTSFKFKLGGANYLLSELDMPKVKLVKLKGS